MRGALSHLFSKALFFHIKCFQNQDAGQNDNWRDVFLLGVNIK